MVFNQQILPFALVVRLLRTFIDPAVAIVLSMFMLSFIFVIVCGLFEWKRICAGFFLAFACIKQEVPTLPEHLVSSTVFSGVMFCRSVLVLLSFFFGHCIILSNSFLEPSNNTMVGKYEPNSIKRIFPS